MSTEERMDRIESKIDKLSEVLVQMARVEERILNGEEQHKEIRSDIRKLNDKVGEMEKVVQKNQITVNIINRISWIEMYGPKSPERAAWVPESIADEQVEAFMEAAITSMLKGADAFVFEGKHYKTKKKSEAKLDPVGQEDDDVDNDGDVDSSDKYLKKRRSAIKKAMDEEKIDEISRDKLVKARNKAEDDMADAMVKGDGPRFGKRLRQSRKFTKAAQKKLDLSPKRESVEENYTDKQDASYRDEPTPKGAKKRLKALHKKALAYRKKHGKFPSDPYSAAKKNKMDLKFESTETIDEAMSGTYMTVDYDYSDNFGILELFKNGKKIGSWDGYPSSESGKNYLAIEATKLAKKHGVNPNGLKTVDAENPKRVGKLVPNKDFGFPAQKAKRESVEEEKKGLWYNIHKKRKEGRPMRKPGSEGAPTKDDFKKARGEQVEESAGTAQHSKDAATSDTFQKQMGGGRSPREKEFVDMHNLEVALDAEKIHDDNKANIEKALKQTPARMGDNLKNGDTSFVSPLKADIIDGITKALQQMKTNN
jgi:hypothetical protein